MSVVAGRIDIDATGTELRCRFVVETEPVPLDPAVAEPSVGEPPAGPAWRSPVAWVGAGLLLLVASGGPVVWARAELADLTSVPADDIWIQSALVIAAGLVIAFCGDGLATLRHDRAALVPLAALLGIVASSTIWSVDASRTLAQFLLIAFASVAAVFGGAALTRTQSLTALWLALHLGVLLSALADLRDWPLASDAAGRLTGLFGTNDALGMITLLAAASTLMLMVTVLERTPEEKLAAAEAKAARGGGGFSMPSMRQFNELKRYGNAAQRGQLPGGPGRRTPRSPGQAMQYRTSMRARRRRTGNLDVLKATPVGRIASVVLLLGFLVLDGLLWWFTGSYGALFAIIAAGVVMVVVGLCLPGGNESGKRAAAAAVTVLVTAGVVALVVFRDTVGEWFDRDGTWSGRTTTWDGALEVARERPVFGYGFEAGTDVGAVVARSGFLQVLVGVGLIGLAALVWTMLTSLRRTASAAISRPDALGVWVVGIAAYGIAANVNESFVSAFSLPWLLLLFGLGHAVTRREERYDDVPA